MMLMQLMQVLNDLLINMRMNLWARMLLPMLLSVDEDVDAASAQYVGVVVAMRSSYI